MDKKTVVVTTNKTITAGVQAMEALAKGRLVVRATRTMPVTGPGIRITGLNTLSTASTLLG